MSFICKTEFANITASLIFNCHPFSSVYSTSWLPQGFKSTSFPTSTYIFYRLPFHFSWLFDREKGWVKMHEHVHKETRVEHVNIDILYSYTVIWQFIEAVGVLKHDVSLCLSPEFFKVKKDFCIGPPEATTCRVHEKVVSRRQNPRFLCNQFSITLNNENQKKKKILFLHNVNQQHEKCHVLKNINNHNKY